ncbi:MAG: WbqC family protein, partial [Lutibacter sp.]|nr:WbqC family protein [Lutibacter sp.]
YKKAPFFEYYWPFIEEIYSNNSNHLVSHVFKTMKFSFKELGITTKIVCASELEVQGTKSDLVLDICKKNNAKIYLTGNGFFNYLPANGKEIFSQGGVSIVLQQFSHPTYTQVGKNDFVAGLGILDLLFNEGPIKAKEIFWRNIQKDNREDYEL